MSVVLMFWRPSVSVVPKFWRPSVSEPIFNGGPKFYLQLLINRYALDSFIGNKDNKTDAIFFSTLPARHFRQKY